MGGLCRRLRWKDSPLPVPPPQAGEGTLAISVFDEGHSVPPLPRSGGGLGRGPSYFVA